MLTYRNNSRSFKNSICQQYWVDRVDAIRLGSLVVSGCTAFATLLFVITSDFTDQSSKYYTTNVYTVRQGLMELEIAQSNNSNTIELYATDKNLDAEELNEIKQTSKKLFDKINAVDQMLVDSEKNRVKEYKNNQHILWTLLSVIISFLGIGIFIPSKNTLNEIYSKINAYCPLED